MLFKIIFTTIWIKPGDRKCLSPLPAFLRSNTKQRMHVNVIVHPPMSVNCCQSMIEHEISKRIGENSYVNAWNFITSVHKEYSEHKVYS